MHHSTSRALEQLPDTHQTARVRLIGTVFDVVSLLADQLDNEDIIGYSALVEVSSGKSLDATSGEPAEAAFECVFGVPEGGHYVVRATTDPHCTMPDFEEHDFVDLYPSASAQELERSDPERVALARAAAAADRAKRAATARHCHAVPLGQPDPPRPAPPEVSPPPSAGTGEGAPERQPTERTTEIAADGPPWLHLMLGDFEQSELYMRMPDNTYVGNWSGTQFENEAELRAWVRQKRGSDATLVAVDSPAHAQGIKTRGGAMKAPAASATAAGRAQPTPSNTAARAETRPATLAPSTGSSRQAVTGLGASGPSQKRRRRKQPGRPGYAHALSRSIIRGRAPEGTLVVAAADLADVERQHGGLVWQIAADVLSEERAKVEFFGQSGIPDLEGVYTFLDVVGSKNAPGGRGCACVPGVFIVSGHGVDGYLADADQYGQWRLSDVAAQLVRRLPRVRLIMFALCSTDADAAVKRELAKIDGPMIMGLRGDVEDGVAKGIVQTIVRLAWSNVDAFESDVAAFATTINRGKTLVKLN